MKNTEYEIKAVDLIAFCELLEMNNISFNINEKRKCLEAEFSRYTMNQNDYYIGYEYYTIRWKTFKKNDYNIIGIPTSIFKEFIVPDAFDIIKIKGAERENKNYYKADSDFVWHEIDSWLRLNLPDLPEAEFDREKRKWSCGYFEEYLD